MNTVLLLPVQSRDTVPLLRDIPFENKGTSIAVLRVPKSRWLWRELAPCLLEAHRVVSRRLLECILAARWNISYYSSFCGDKITTGWPSELNKCRKRTLKVSPTCGVPNQIVLLVPPLLTQLETSFTGRLLAWENRLVQARSISAFISTIGGGYFLCHHFQTALVLAKQQQRMAIILGNEQTFWQCMLHISHNLMHSGHFYEAGRWIRYVYGNSRHDVVISNMCKSADVLRKRMIHARMTGMVKNTVETDRPVDDYSRIRVFRDQSLAGELADLEGSLKISLSMSV